jgi:hypothetical protein
MFTFSGMFVFLGVLVVVYGLMVVDVVWLFMCNKHVLILFESVLWSSTNNSSNVNLSYTTFLLKFGDYEVFKKQRMESWYTCVLNPISTLYLPCYGFELVNFGAYSAL